MITTHYVKCDQCDEPMLLQSRIGRRTQTYKCHHCTDRWAFVRLNSQGGVNTVSYRNGRELTKDGLAVAAGLALGEVLSRTLKKKRKKN